MINYVTNNTLSKIKIPSLPLSFFIAVFCMTGIICAYIDLNLISTIMGLTFFTYVITSGKYLNTALFIIAFCSGYITQSLTKIKFENFETSFCDEQATIIGYVKELKIDDTKQFKYILKLESEKIWLRKKANKIHRVILINSFKPIKLNIGQKILVKNIKLKKIKDNEFKKYLIKNNIANSTFINSLDVKILESPSNIFEIIQNFVNKKIDEIKSKSDNSAFNFFESIFLGNKENLNNNNTEEINHFNEWGIAHILARSGLHLVILVMLFRFILNLSLLPFILQRLLVFLIMLFFYFTSSIATPFLRAFLMYSIFEISTLLRLQTNMLHIFCIATSIIILINPSLIFFLDFQLSFGITLILLLWAS